MSKQHVLGAYLLALILIVLDQATKLWANSALVYMEPVSVLPVLNWSLAYNTGAAWSFLADAGGWQRWLLAAISAVVSLVIIVWIPRLRPPELGLSWPLALILGGAIGNLIDRLAYGYVIDFIQMYYQNWYFPTYNVADIGITVGAIWLLLLSLVTPTTQENKT